MAAPKNLKKGRKEPNKSKLLQTKAQDGKFLMNLKDVF